MIPALSAPLTRSAQTPAPNPAPPQPAPAPFDGLDLSSIDTPAKAAALPLLDPGMLTAIAAAALVGSNGAKGAVHAELSTGTHEMQGNPYANKAVMDFQVEASNHQQPLTGGGIIGGRFDSSTVTFDEAHKSAQYTSVRKYDDLTITANEAQNNVHVDGHVGTVDTHLTLSNIENNLPQDTFGIHSEGTLGGQAYITDTMFHVSKMDHGTLTAHISASGKLGQDAISKEYDVHGSANAGGAQMSVAGHGNIAGVPTTLSVEAHVNMK